MTKKLSNLLKIPNCQMWKHNNCCIHVSISWSTKNLYHTKKLKIFIKKMTWLKIKHSEKFAKLQSWNSTKLQGTAHLAFFFLQSHPCWKVPLTLGLPHPCLTCHDHHLKKKRFLFELSLAQVVKTFGFKMC